MSADRHFFKIRFLLSLFFKETVAFKFVYPCSLFNLMIMQNYKNHRRYYPFHHYVITPLTFFFLSWSFWNVSEALANEQDIAISIYFLTGAMMDDDTTVTKKTEALVLIFNSTVPGSVRRGASSWPERCWPMPASWT
jgi:hypothetical protein